MIKEIVESLKKQVAEGWRFSVGPRGGLSKVKVTNKLLKEVLDLTDALNDIILERTGTCDCLKSIEVYNLIRTYYVEERKG
jgi:hypothetical protein